MSLQFRKKRSFVMLNLFQHRINETLKQVQGDERSTTLFVTQGNLILKLSFSKDFGRILGFRIERPWFYTTKPVINYMLHCLE